MSQAATQLNEPTIAFVAKAAALTAVLFALGSLLIGHLVEFTTLLFQRIPHLIGWDTRFDGRRDTERPTAFRPSA